MHRERTRRRKYEWKRALMNDIKCSITGYINYDYHEIYYAMLLNGVHVFVEEKEDQEMHPLLESDSNDMSVCVCVYGAFYTRTLHIVHVDYHMKRAVLYARLL